MHKIRTCAWKKMMAPELELNINELLPPELLLQVLQQLPPRSLLSAVLVCRLWHGLAHQAPQLWSWVHLTGLSINSSALVLKSFFSLAGRPLFGSPLSQISPVFSNPQVSHSHLNVITSKKPTGQKARRSNMIYVVSIYMNMA